MGRKRDQLVEGEYDQITENLNKMRKRFAREVLRDVGAWLIMHWLRHSARVDAADHAEQSGNRAWAEGVRADAKRACDVLCGLVAELDSAWTVKDWHEAQKFLDTMIAARGPDGKPLHQLGEILTAKPELTDGNVPSREGTDLAFDARVPGERPGGV